MTSTGQKNLGHELNTTTRKLKETIHSIKTENCINGISYKLPDIWLQAIKVKHDGKTQTENNRQNSPNRVHQGPQFQKPAKNFLMCPHRSNFNTYIRLHPPKHLPEDERSFSRNVASLKNMIKDKTNCSSESIQHTESTNLNICRIIQCDFYSFTPSLQRANTQFIGTILISSKFCQVQQQQDSSHHNRCIQTNLKYSYPER